LTANFLILKYSFHSPFGVELKKRQGVDDATDIFIACAYCIKAISSNTTKAKVHHLQALGFADSHIILHVQSLRDIFINLLHSVPDDLSSHLGNIQVGRFLIMNLIFSKCDLISQFLSTSSAFLLIYRLLRL